MRGEEARVLDGVTLNGRQRLGTVRHARGVPKIDEAFIRQMLMQRAIDSESANAAIEDANG